MFPTDSYINKFFEDMDPEELSNVVLTQARQIDQLQKALLAVDTLDQITPELGSDAHAENLDVTKLTTNAANPPDDGSDQWNNIAPNSGADNDPDEKWELLDSPAWAYEEQRLHLSGVGRAAGVTVHPAGFMQVIEIARPCSATIQVQLDYVTGHNTAALFFMNEDGDMWAVGLEGDGGCSLVRFMSIGEFGLGGGRPSTMWLRIVDTGTGMEFWASPDNKVWSLILTEGYSYLADKPPVKFGFLVTTRNGFGVADPTIPGAMIGPFIVNAELDTRPHVGNLDSVSDDVTLGNFVAYQTPNRVVDSGVSSRGTAVRQVLGTGPDPFLLALQNFDDWMGDFVLTGLSLATSQVIAATDTMLEALGYLQAQISEHLADTGNPHAVTKSQVGLGSLDNVQQLPMSYLDTDGALAANSDTRVASQKAIKAYVDAGGGGGGGGSLPYWLAYHPQAPPVSPTAYDELWDDSTGMSGPGNSLDARWTPFGSSQSLHFANGHLVMTSTSPGAPSNTGISQTQPSTPYKVTVPVSIDTLDNYNVASVGFGDGSGALWCVSIYTSASTPRIIYQEYTSPTNQLLQNIDWFPFARQVWLQVENDGSNVFARWSQSGIDGTFITLVSLAYASAITPTEIFIGLNSYSGSPSVATFGQVLVT